jgi:Ni/Co efflux regulator RcnB
MKKLLTTLMLTAFVVSGSAAIAMAAGAEKDTKAAKDESGAKDKKAAPAPKAEGDKAAGDKKEKK